MSKFFLVIVSLMSLFALITKQTHDIKKAGWLIGTWENKTTKGSIYESWEKSSNHEFSAKSYYIKDNDTVVLETIRLTQEQDRLYFIPTVKNQNDNLPVRFASKIVSETRLVFENPDHDFPQIISYTKISSDSLVAEISGINEAKESRQKFSMKRVN